MKIPLRQPKFLGSATFYMTLVVASAFAVFIIVLFGFIYGKIDRYLVTRSDSVITAQINGIIGLPQEMIHQAVDERLRQDPRGVQLAAIFAADGHRVGGNLQGAPPELRIDGLAQAARIVRIDRNRGEHQTIRAIARRMPNGEVLVMGRNIDEANELAVVVSEAMALGLVPGFCLCLVAGAWISRRAQRRVAEVNERVQRIVAGDLHERLPYSSGTEPFCRLAIIVNGMLDEMENMIRALEGVGNDIAHDLRTPLTRARIILERGLSHATTLEQLQSAVDKAIAGIDQSLSIVTALLRLAEIENSRRSAGFGEVAIGDMLREVFDIYEPIADSKGVTLRIGISSELSVRGDRDLLMEAVANLVDNAIKFTPEGGRIDLELLRQRHQTILRVTDTGSGIAEQEREAVLRRFYRSDKIRNTPGVGLGLNLVAAIVRLHGFRLAIRSGPGARMEIVCPDQPREGEKAQWTPATAQAVSPVLVQAS